MAWPFLLRPSCLRVSAAAGPLQPEAAGVCRQSSTQRAVLSDGALRSLRAGGSGAAVGATVNSISKLSAAGSQRGSSTQVLSVSSKPISGRCNAGASPHSIAELVRVCSVTALGLAAGTRRSMWLCVVNRKKRPDLCPAFLFFWWRRGGSNSRPSHCERDALPAELRPQNQLKILANPSCRDQPPISACCCAAPVRQKAPSGPGRPGRDRPPGQTAAQTRS